MALSGGPPPAPQRPTGGGETGVSCQAVATVVGLVALAGAFALIILASVLVPVVRRSKEQGYRSKCLSNERALGIALQSYANDHGGYLPDGGQWVTQIGLYTGSSPPSAPYYGGVTLDDMMTCPSVVKLPVARTYGFNSELSGRLQGQVARPADIVALFESSAFTHDPSDPGTSLVRPGRHGHGNNCCFADGHAQWCADGAPLRFRLSAPGARP
jgi:prepilin-type processing-associated H-X9-DG protein